MIQESSGGRGVNPVDLEGALVLGELLEIAGSEFALDRLLVLGIDQGNTGALEACT